MMSKKTLTSLNQVLRRLRAINLWQLAGITILAEIITAVMNTIMGIIWWGRVSYDLIMIGTVDALVASIVVGTIVLYIIEQLRETDKKYHELAEREVVELALRESEERFRGIFEQNEDALILLERSTGKLLDANSAAIDIFGYTQQEFISGGLPLILMPREHEQFRSELLSSAASGRLRIAQITSRKKNGTTIMVSVWGSAVRLKKSEVLFCSFRNITERLRLEEEAKLLQAKLIQMNKMTSLGMLVSGMAHEINNPNHFIKVNAQMVSDAWKDAANVLSDHYREHGDFPLGSVPYSEMQYIMPQLLTAMSEGSDRIKNIVDNLKDFSKQGGAALEKTVDVNKVITTSAALLNSQIGKFTDRFQLRESVNLLMAKGSKQQLEQVVINLIMNALQSLRDRNAGVIVSSCLEKETNNILIQVKDEGIGMPQEVLSHITEAFYTTKIDEGGTGLGLSISFSIIKDHQGSLTFLSEPGKGTTATISLPAYQSSPERNRNATDHVS
jgi:PAS domain S-box-containing protein